MGSKKSSPTFPEAAPKGKQSAGEVMRSTWLGGLADTKLVDAAADPDGNNLHLSAGHACPACGRAIESYQSVRRMASGEYEHDIC